MHSSTVPQLDVQFTVEPSSANSSEELSSPKELFHNYTEKNFRPSSKHLRDSSGVFQITVTTVSDGKGHGQWNTVLPFTGRIKHTVYHRDMWMPAAGGHSLKRRENTPLQQKDDVDAVWTASEIVVGDRNVVEMLTIEGRRSRVA